jgi:hypothetical protein
MCIKVLSGDFGVHPLAIDGRKRGIGAVVRCRCMYSRDRSLLDSLRDDSPPVECVVESKDTHVVYNLRKQWPVLGCVIPVVLGVAISLHANPVDQWALEGVSYRYAA